MKQQYFILVLAHSLHGRLRRIHVPHKLVYGVLGLALIGAGLGLGRIGGQAAEAIARQPEAANDIRGTALFIAFLMEGATIIAVIMSLAAKLIG